MDESSFSARIRVGNARKAFGTLSLLFATAGLPFLQPVTAVSLAPLIAVAWFDYRYKLVPKDVVGSIALGVALLNFRMDYTDLISLFLLCLFLLLLMSEREREAYGTVLAMLVVAFGSFIAEGSIDHFVWATLGLALGLTENAIIEDSMGGDVALTALIFSVLGPLAVVPHVTGDVAGYLLFIEDVEGGRAFPVAPALAVTAVPVALAASSVRATAPGYAPAVVGGILAYVLLRHFGGRFLPLASGIVLGLAVVFGVTFKFGFPALVLLVALFLWTRYLMENGSITYHGKSTVTPGELHWGSLVVAWLVTAYFLRGIDVKAPLLFSLLAPVILTAVGTREDERISTLGLLRGALLGFWIGAGLEILALIWCPL
ncbi:hypothetical protein A3L11_08530 [Thermococcus siculi]|uniref:Uncharacterized protein n=2 Tax=Thermococcus siculi TaxID=72803 RepID=A0A2Z2MPF3_9EURY|nr:hypothetical protein A3L11_08530 [Thermococcus siculi]